MIQVNPMDGHQHTPLYAKAELFKASHASMLINRYHLNGDHEAHSHDFFEVTIITDGEGLHTTSDGRQPARQGDVFVIRPGAWHAYNDCSHLQGYNCCFAAELLQRELFWVREDALLNAVFWAGPLARQRKGVLALHVTGETVAQCQTYLDQMVEFDRSDRMLTKPELLGYLLVLMSTLARSLDLDDTRQIGAVHPAVIEGIRLLEADPAYEWSLVELAARLHLNHSHLARLFSAALGLPPMEYLARYRAERAAALLLNTELSVGEIGQKVGWADPNYFARRFRLFLGLSPSQYRQHLSRGM
ncbi:MAG TPA: AraC family transcriptional regulator [Phototrophicaceae bacterium]|nr:AraC family transcriptional regulator [Phototrophicaceae bacterium]